MSESMEHLTTEETRARDAVRALSAPVADPDFRARLKREFVAGAIVGTTRLTVVPRRRMAPVAWIGIPVAAAALILAVSALNRAPGWEVASTGGAAPIVVDGRAIPATHPEALARALRPGARVQTAPGPWEGAQWLEVMSHGTAAIQIAPGSDVTLPPLPGRWFARDVGGALRMGEVRIMTGRRFHGARLALRTPEADVHVTGTTLAVIRDSSGTCVCVLEGVVQMGRPGGPMEPVEHGHLRFEFGSGAPPAHDAMRPVERSSLTTWHEARKPALE